MKDFHLSGTSSSAKIASTGHAGTQAPQSMHSSGWMNSCSADSNSGSSLRGWMQSTGQTSTQALSFVPMHGSQMIYATWSQGLPAGEYNSEVRVSQTARRTSPGRGSRLFVAGLLLILINALV